MNSKQARKMINELEAGFRVKRVFSKLVKIPTSNGRRWMLTLQLNARGKLMQCQKLLWSGGTYQRSINGPLKSN